jgi:oxygen-dependent protoporphyrinogen oxidase
MFSFKNGLKVLPETLASKLKTPIEFNATVKQVQKLNEGWEITYNQQNEIKILKADNLIYAGTGHQLANCKIMNDKNLDLSFGNEIEYPPVATLTLGFHKSQIQHALNGFGLLVPQVESLQILGALFNSSLFPYRAPDDHVTITVFMGGVRQPELALESEEKRLDIAVNDLTMLLGITGSPALIFHKQWTKAIPQYNVGYGDIKSKFQRLEKDNPGLYFTGNYREGISVADTILHALQTADQIISTNNIN